MKTRRGYFYDMLPMTSKRNAALYARRKSGASLAAGIATGVAVGALAGILLAPKAGKETREDIKFKSEEVAAKVKDTTKRTVQVVKDKIAKINNKEECVDETEEVTEE